MLREELSSKERGPIFLVCVLFLTKRKVMSEVFPQSVLPKLPKQIRWVLQAPEKPHKNVSHVQHPMTCASGGYSSVTLPDLPESINDQRLELGLMPCPAPTTPPRGACTKGEPVVGTQLHPARPCWDQDDVCGTCYHQKLSGHPWSVW